MYHPSLPTESLWPLAPGTSRPASTLVSYLAQPLIDLVAHLLGVAESTCPSEETKHPQQLIRLVGCRITRNLRHPIRRFTRLGAGLRIPNSSGMRLCTSQDPAGSALRLATVDFAKFQQISPKAVSSQVGELQASHATPTAARLRTCALSKLCRHTSAMPESKAATGLHRHSRKCCFLRTRERAGTTHACGAGARRCKRHAQHPVTDNLGRYTLMRRTHALLRTRRR